MLNYQSIEVNGSVYAYTSQGSGEPLVLLHGFTGSSKTWRKFIPEWQESNQVITIDLPGHGKTAATLEKTMMGFSKDLAQIFNVLQIEKAHLLGYSLGGRAALSFAMEYPSLISSLILESASPGIADQAERFARQEADEKLAERIKRDGMEKFVNFWQDIGMFSSQKSLPQHVQETVRQERLSQSELGLANSLLFMGTGVQSSWWDRLSEINYPVFLIVGSIDKKFVELNEKMLKLISTAEIITVSDAGHAVHVEQVEKFAMIVRASIS